MLIGAEKMAPQESQERRIEIEKRIEKSKAELKIIQDQCKHEEFIFVNTGDEGYYFCQACKKAIAANQFLAREKVIGAIGVSLS